jgi:large subunit ribosomal protein L18
MDAQRLKHKRQWRRRMHVRKKTGGTAERPRLTVFRSSKHIYAQLIDDVSGVTLASASTVQEPVAKESSYGGNIKAAEAVGRQLAAVALQKGITKAAFDRGHYRFHGRVKALALAANAAGLKCSEPKPGKKQKAPKEPVAAAAPAKGEKAKGEKAKGEKPKGEKPKGEKPKKEPS